MMGFVFKRRGGPKSSEQPLSVRGKLSQEDEDKIYETGDRFDDVLTAIKKGAPVACGTNARKGVLDFVLGRRFDCGEFIDRFSLEQRIHLFGAMKDSLEAKSMDPCDLLSHATLGLVVEYGRIEMIPLLHEIGVPFSDNFFVNTLYEYGNTPTTRKVIQAMLPYMENGVNSLSNVGQNLGHQAAELGDLEFFAWLDCQGLDRDARYEGTGYSTYAHQLCLADGLTDQERREQEKFVTYLAERGFPIDISCEEVDADGFIRVLLPPARVAFADGQPGLGLAFVRNGAELKADYLVEAIKGIKHVPYAWCVEAVVELVDLLEARDLLTADLVQESCGIMHDFVEQCQEREAFFTPIVDSLFSKNMRALSNEHSIKAARPQKDEGDHISLSLCGPK